MAEIIVNATNINIEVLTNKEQSLKLLMELNEACKDLKFSQGLLQSISVAGFITQSVNDTIAIIGSYELYLYAGERKDPEDMPLNSATWGRVSIDLPPTSISLNT